MVSRLSNTNRLVNHWQLPEEILNEILIGIDESSLFCASNVYVATRRLFIVKSLHYSDFNSDETDLCGSNINLENITVL